MSDLDIDSNFVLSSAIDLNYSSKSNTTNTSSSSNSLHFNEDEEEDEFSTNKEEAIEASGFVTAKSLSANSINTGSELIASLTSSLTRTNPSSSSSSSTTSSASSTEAHHHLPPAQTNNNRYVFLLNAFVNGFAQLKLSADKIDYEYIIEIYWSNEARTYVKRTYEDFVTFHRHLLQTFSQFFNEIKSNVNTRPANSNSSHLSRLYLMPVLPAAKKPFWISQLKLAESREIELNNYVQRILKLPSNIAHSDLVLKFFESQTSDPKPAKNTKNYTSAPTGELINCDNIQEISVSNIELSQNSNQFYEYDDDDEYEEEEYEDDEEDGQYLRRNITGGNSYNNMPISHSLIGLNQCIASRKQSGNREAGLWWDEDEALNELTSSTSFDFGASGAGQYNQINFEDFNDDGSDDLETLNTLEKILKNSELFRGEGSASTSTMLRQTAENQMSGKRLSLS